MQKPLANSSIAPKPKMASVQNCSTDVSTAYEAAQTIARLPYLEALKLTAACEADVDKLVDGALALLVAEQANVQS